jgi:hypothetical protein
MLRELEDQYGPRDPSYTILGLEFCGEVPQVWFPGNCRHVVIQLTPSTMNDVVRAVYQLAHEAVHLLDPGVFGNASVFEEGVATLFSVQYARTIQPSYTPAHPKYDAAARLASRALGLRPDVVKVLRAQGMRFSGITPASLVAACPQLAPEVAESLCVSFQAWHPSAAPGTSSAEAVE